jgi:hypothetical protein
MVFANLANQLGVLKLGWRYVHVLVEILSTYARTGRYMHVPLVIMLANGYYVGAVGSDRAPADRTNIIAICQHNW